MKRCLIVDDDQQDRLTLGSYLAAYGFELIQANDLASALSACHAAMPDMVMLAQTADNDETMSFIRRLRRAAADDAPVVILCARSADPGVIGQAIWEGASEYVMKPVDRKVLDSKLRQAGIV